MGILYMLLHRRAMNRASAGGVRSIYGGDKDIFLAGHECPVLFICN
jgi:hypothetical protein